MAMVESPIPEDGENSKRFRLGDDDEEDNNNGKGEDRLSSLPNVLLVEILSLLPIESAAATSVLSRRWKHLWTQVTRLHIFRDNSAMWKSFDRDDEINKICRVIDHIFRHLTSPRLHGFHLFFQSTPPIDHPESFCSCVASWIRQVCARNVEEIKVLVFSGSNMCLIPLPTCVFETQSLVVLKLCEWFDYKFPHNGIISFPNLRILSLHIRDWNLELMALLFKSCPLLEDLYLYLHCNKDDGLVDISCQSVKRLTISLEGFSRGNQFRIDTPHIEYFNMRTPYLSSHCFVRDLSCLLEAEIVVEGNIYILRNQNVSNNLNRMLELVRGVYRVRSLFLSSLVFDCLYYLNATDKILPIFHNLTRLGITFRHPHGWNGLLRFLRCSPNLEDLVVFHDGGDRDRNYTDWTVPNGVPVCLLNKLKRMEIVGLQAYRNELNFLRYILSNTNVLEFLLLRLCDYMDEGELSQELEFCESLSRCPRSSAACEIEVSGKFLSASSKGFNKISIERCI